MRAHDEAQGPWGRWRPSGTACCHLAPGQRHPGQRQQTYGGDSGLQEAAGWRTRPHRGDGGRVSSTWARRTSIITTMAPLPPHTEENLHAEGSSTEAPIGAPGPAASPPGAAASSPERSGGISASNTVGGKPVGLWDPHHPSNSLIPLPSAAQRYWGMGAKLGTSFIPQAIWLLNPHTNSLAATVSHHNLLISNPVHCLTSHDCYSCCIWVGARDRK